MARVPAKIAAGSVSLRRPMPDSLSQIIPRGTAPSWVSGSHEPSSRSSLLRVGIILASMNRENAHVITSTGNRARVPSSRRISRGGNHRSRGAINGIGAIAYAAGCLITPLLADRFTLSISLVAAGFVVAVTPMVGWAALGVIHHKTTPDDTDVQLLSSLPVFAALPAVAVCRIACTAQPRRFTAGQTVVLEGAPGEEFYIVRSGALAVTQGGIEVRRLGPGQSFGEVALLRAVPHTATVRAITDVDLLCIGQELFVASITGHRATDAAAGVKIAAPLDEDKHRWSRTERRLI